VNRLRAQNLSEAILTLIVLGASGIAQQKDTPCSSMPQYQNRNQVDEGHLVVNDIKGQATDANSAGVPGLCVALFTEREHRLITSTVTDEDGNYELSKIRPGQYRLVIQGQYFCPANTKLVVAQKRLPGTYRQRLYAHLRASGVDTCSYINNTRPYIENGI
jgi:protocatechuate 3,4-dioxygenase beta subunit